MTVNPAWALGQESGKRDGPPSPDSPSDMPSGMPSPQPGFLQLGELAPGITLKLWGSETQANWTAWLRVETVLKTELGFFF